MSRGGARPSAQQPQRAPVAQQQQPQMNQQGQLPPPQQAAPQLPPEGAPVTFAGQHWLNLLLGLAAAFFIFGFWHSQSWTDFLLITALGFALGVLLIIPIGGADMPTVIALLNSYAGIAAALLGFVLENNLLIVAGALDGMSGLILAIVMCRAMNRSFSNVLFGAFGQLDESGGEHGEMGSIRSASYDEAGEILKNSRLVVIVPGYGMAVAQAQHKVRELADTLAEEGVEVKYAIHPVAGRMPGHMNVLLAEANVPYDEVFELDDINRDFASTDVAFVIGANDVTNPAAKTDPKSAIYGMPILDVEKAGTVLFIKRGMASGYAGVENELFFRDNTMMLFADAKVMCENIVKALEGSAH